VVVGETVIALLIAPVDHVIELEQLDNVNVTLPEPQMDSADAVIAGVWGVPTFILILPVPAQTDVPHDAVYNVVWVGVTLILFPVWPVLQVRVLAHPVAVSSTVSPEHTELLFAVMVTELPVPTVISCEPVPAHVPVPQVAVYVCVAVGLTVIELAVEPVLQVKPWVQAEAVSVVLSPKHIWALLAVIVRLEAVLTDIEIEPVPAHVPVPQVAE
jgi:hypothetical protein